MIALDAAQEELRNFDRVEAASRDETPDFRGGLTFPDCRSCCEGLPSARTYRDQSSRGTSRGDPVVIDWVRTTGQEAILRTLSAFIIFAAALALAGPASAADPFPVSGAAKLAAYSVCRSAVIVDMGPIGSNSSAECTGIVKTSDGSKILDNLAIHCIEDAKARRDAYAYSGTCVQTDGDGDKIFMTFEGAEGGSIEWIGGTGKYEDVVGKGTWSVVDAPANNAQLFAYTLTYDVNWTSKTK